MNDSPLVILMVFAGALYLAKLWWDDRRKWREGETIPNALPGASPASMAAVLVAITGALVLVGIETAGEIALGVSDEQTTIAAIFLLAMIGAGILEEVVFRGYLVITGKGRGMLIGSIVGFSLLFALLHFNYYTEVPEDGKWYEFSFVISAKPAWSLLILFLNSLWFYTVRFYFLNPHHSLLPCMLAHIASNVAVFLVKAAQGHVVGWW